MDSRQAPTVLIVDDTPANLSVIVERIEQAGWCVVVAQDGEEALDRVKFVLPDLVLMDVRMPGIGGCETCRRLKADPRLRDVPVVFMTAEDDPGANLPCFEAGGVDCVTKPLHIGETLARLRAHLEWSTRCRWLADENRRLAGLLPGARESP